MCIRDLQISSLVAPLLACWQFSAKTGMSFMRSLIALTAVSCQFMSTC